MATPDRRRQGYRGSHKSEARSQDKFDLADLVTSFLKTPSAVRLERDTAFGVIGSLYNRFDARTAMMRDSVVGGARALLAELEADIRLNVTRVSDLMRARKPWMPSRSFCLRRHPLEFQLRRS